MKNKEEWQPSKFVYRNGKLRASKDTKEVSVSSRLIADIVARFYDSHLKEHAKGKLLDLGCGKIPLFGSYKNYIDENICIDWENTIHKNPHLDFECDLNGKLNLSDNEFDTIILSDVLEHIKEPTELWLEMNRVLKKGGIVIMNVPYFYLLHEEPHDYYRYTKFALQYFAEKSDFKVLKLNPYAGVIEILGDISAKLLIKVPVIGKAVSVTIQNIVWAFGKTKFGKKVSSATAEKYPLGYFLIAEKK